MYRVVAGHAEGEGAVAGGPLRWLASPSPRLLYPGSPSLSLSLPRTGAAVLRIFAILKSDRKLQRAFV